mgnify:CR=1 FL=1
MNFKSFALNLIISCSPLLFFGQNIIKTSKTNINHVTVFNNGAEINRSGKVTLNQGANEIVIQQLSPYIKDQTIQAKIADKDVIISSVNHAKNYLAVAETKAKEYSVLKDSLELMEYKLRIREVHMSVYQEEKNLLDKNKSYSNKEFIIDDLMELSEYFGERMMEIETNLMEANHSIKKIKKTISNLKSQLNAIQQKNRNNSSGEITLQVSCKQSTTVNFSLKYNVSNAGWAPLYDVRSVDVSSPIELTYKAKVYQNTKEDWENVSLSLSTGKLNQSNRQPSFSTDYISFVPDYDYKTTRNKAVSYNASPNMVVEMAASPESAVFELEESGSSADFTVVNFGGVFVKYDIQIPYNIPSNGKTNYIEIQKINIPTTYDYYSIPKEDKDAFLMANLTGLGNYNLLPGQANIYYKGSSVGETYLNTKSTKNIISISLGRDKSIIITRNKINDYSSSSTIGSQKKTDKGYEIKIRNNKNKEVTLRLIDQIPVSKDKGIDVIYEEISGGKLNSDNGKIKWTITLQPDESKTILLKYYIKHPKDKSIRNW